MHVPNLPTNLPNLGEYQRLFTREAVLATRIALRLLGP